jgi:hypothetical protein
MKALFYGLCPLLLVAVSGLPAMAVTGSLPQTRIQQSIASTQKQSSPANSVQASAQPAKAMTRVQQALTNRHLGYWQ